MWIENFRVYIKMIAPLDLILNLVELVHIGVRYVNIYGKVFSIL